MDVILENNSWNLERKKIIIEVINPEILSKWWWKNNVFGLDKRLTS